MSAVTIWSGPVSQAQTQDLRWPGSHATYLTCTGDGDPSCAELAVQRPLAQVVGDASEVYLAAFSAGGQIVKRWLPDARVRGVYLADATYTHWADAKKPAADPSLVQWVVRAAKDPGLRAVFTASSWPNKDLPNGAETLAAIAEAAEGVRWNKKPIAVGGLKVERMWSAGGAYLIDLGRSVKHEEHATKIAPLLWPKLFTINGTPGANASRRSFGPVLLLGAGVLVVTVAALALRKPTEKGTDKPREGRRAYG